MFVYVVTGVTGEYSDMREWPVCAYFELEPALKHAHMAQQRAEEIKADCDNKGVSRYNYLETSPNEWDPTMRMDYTGTEYYVSSVKSFVRAKYLGVKTGYDK